APRTCYAASPTRSSTPPLGLPRPWSIVPSICDRRCPARASHPLHRTGRSGARVVDVPKLIPSLVSSVRTAGVRHGLRGTPSQGTGRVARSGGRVREAIQERDPDHGAGGVPPTP